VSAVGAVALGKCPACGSPDAVPFARGGALTLRRCRNCSLVYSDPQPRGGVRLKYLHEYDLAEHFGAMAPRKRVLFERRLRRLPAPSPGRDRLCDVGCADGQFLELARSRGWKPFGVEMNPPAAARARELGANVFEGIFEEIEDLPWGTFDLVTSWDSLEHTPDPRSFAERLVRLLAPGGILALTTLNRRSLAWLVFRMRWSMVVEDHFTYWDGRSLSLLFGSLGLTVVDREIFGLGRDFVKGLDRFRKRPVQGEASHRSGDWDVNPFVLKLESALNAAFRNLGGGVGIGMTLQLP
jgi:SAM-dependent methyltransferase